MDFSWGNTPLVRNEFLNALGKIKFSDCSLDDLDYGAHLGMPELREKILNFTSLIGLPKYKYAVVFNGATQAIGATLSYYASLDQIKHVYTRDLYYPRFPHIIKRHTNNVIHLPKYNSHLRHQPSSIFLIDAPSNPMGYIDLPKVFLQNIIWDAAYCSPTYLNGSLQTNPLQIKNAYLDFSAPPTIISFGKLTGLNGLRLGFVLYNEEKMTNFFLDFLQSTTLSASVLAQKIAQWYLSKEDYEWNIFFKNSYLKLSNNRNEISRLQYLFGNQNIPEYGMFAFFEVDNKLLNLFKKADVLFTNGQSCGARNLSVRINLAKTNEETKKMVDLIIKMDRTI